MFQCPCILWALKTHFLPLYTWKTPLSHASNICSISLFYNSQDTEATEMSINRGVDKENAPHIYNAAIKGTNLGNLFRLEWPSYVFNTNKHIVQSSSMFDFFPTTYIIIRRRQWHPTPVFLPGESHGRRSLVGCLPWGR